MRNTWTNILIGLASVFAFASCDLDTTQSMVLSGNWEGDFGMYYTYKIGGKYYTFNSYDSEIVFYPDYDYATYGYGKEIDYYDYGPYEYQIYYFNWEIVDGVVYLDYPYDNDLSTSIYDYSMTNYSFSGYFGDSDSRFNLRKVYDYYDWTPSVGINSSYSYGYRDNWYFSFSTKAGENLDMTLDATDGEIVSRGNRFTDRAN